MAFWTIWWAWLALRHFFARPQGQVEYFDKDIND